MNKLKPQRRMFPQRNFHYITHFKIGYEGADLAKVTEYQMRFPEGPHHKSRSNEPVYSGNKDYCFQENYSYKDPEQPYALNEPGSKNRLPESYEPGRLAERRPKHSTIKRKSNSEAHRYPQIPYRKATTDPNVVKSSNRKKEDIIESEQLNPQIRPCNPIMTIGCIARKERYGDCPYAEEDSKPPKPCAKSTNNDPPAAIIREENYEKGRGNEKVEHYVNYYYLYS